MDLVEDGLEGAVSNSPILGCDDRFYAPGFIDRGRAVRRDKLAKSQLLRRFSPLGYKLDREFLRIGVNQLSAVLAEPDTIVLSAPRFLTLAGVITGAAGRGCADMRGNTNGHCSILSFLRGHGGSSALRV